MDTVLHSSVIYILVLTTILHPYILLTEAKSASQPTQTKDYQQHEFIPMFTSSLHQIQGGDLKVANVDASLSHNTGTRDAQINSPYVPKSQRAHYAKSVQPRRSEHLQKELPFFGKEEFLFEERFLSCLIIYF